MATNYVDIVSGRKIVGYTTSRLIELKKYKTTTDFTQMYFGDGSVIKDGVDYSMSEVNKFVVYYIGGIRYVDILVNGEPSSTVITYYAQGMTPVDFISERMYKNPNKENIVSNPKIDDDVFIVRQELSVFDNNYRLEFIRNLNELNTFTAGSFFNIVNYT